MSARRTRVELVAVLAIIATAALARFIRLDLMEFKEDEAEACRLALHALGYSEPGVGRFFPTAGLVSSVGVPNPPLFVYVVALPLVLVRSPLAPAAAIAAANVLAVWLCYVAGKRIWSRSVGIVAAALFALSPWSIFFSRKIWAQDLLPLVTTLYLLELHALVVRRKERAVATLVLLAAVGTQLHFSALVLVVVLAAALIAARDAVTWRWIAVGVGGAAALYGPFLVLHGSSLFHPHSSVSPTIVHRLANTVHLTAEIASADQLSSVSGARTPLAEPIGLLLAAVAAVGLAAAARAGSTRARTLAALLTLWYALPALLLTLTPTIAYLHYFIVVLPLPFLGVARCVEYMARRSTPVAAVAVVAALAYFGATDGQLFVRIVRNGGSPGDDGVGYRFRVAIVRDARRLSPGRRIVIDGDVSSNVYGLLLWNADPDRAVPANAPVARYVVVDALQRSAGARTVRPLATAGPLRLVRRRTHSASR
jgi:hypothetical protein